MSISLADLHKTKIPTDEQIAFRLAERLVCNENLSQAPRAKFNEIADNVESLLKSRHVPYKKIAGENPGGGAFANFLIRKNIGSDVTAHVIQLELDSENHAKWKIKEDDIGMSPDLKNSLMKVLKKASSANENESSIESLTETGLDELFESLDSKPVSGEIWEGMTFGQKKEALGIAELSERYNMSRFIGVQKTAPAEYSDFEELPRSLKFKDSNGNSFNVKIVKTFGAIVAYEAFKNGKSIGSFRLTPSNAGQYGFWDEFKDVAAKNGGIGDMKENESASHRKTILNAFNSMIRQGKSKSQIIDKFESMLGDKSLALETVDALWRDSGCGEHEVNESDLEESFVAFVKTPGGEIVKMFLRGDDEDAARKEASKKGEVTGIYYNGKKSPISECGDMQEHLGLVEKAKELFDQGYSKEEVTAKIRKMASTPSDAESIVGKVWPKYEKIRRKGIIHESDSEACSDFGKDIMTSSGCLWFASIGDTGCSAVFKITKNGGQIDINLIGLVDDHSGKSIKRSQNIGSVGFDGNMKKTKDKVKSFIDAYIERNMASLEKSLGAIIESHGLDETAKEEYDDFHEILSNREKAKGGHGEFGHSLYSLLRNGVYATFDVKKDGDNVSLSITGVSNKNGTSKKEMEPVFAGKVPMEAKSSDTRKKCVEFAKDYVEENRARIENLAKEMDEMMPTTNLTSSGLAAAAMGHGLPLFFFSRQPGPDRKKKGTEPYLE